MLQSNLSSPDRIRLDQSFRTGSVQGRWGIGSATSLQASCPSNTQVYVPWLLEGEHRSVDLATSRCYVQAAEGVSVSGCFKGIAGAMSSGCMGDLSMLVIKQEQAAAFITVHSYFQEECSFRFNVISRSNKITAWIMRINCGS